MHLHARTRRALEKAAREGTAPSAAPLLRGPEPGSRRGRAGAVQVVGLSSARPCRGSPAQGCWKPRKRTRRSQRPAHPKGLRDGQPTPPTPRASRSPVALTPQGLRDGQPVPPPRASRARRGSRPRKPRHAGRYRSRSRARRPIQPRRLWILRDLRRNAMLVVQSRPARP